MAKKKVTKTKSDFIVDKNTKQLYFVMDKNEGEHQVEYVIEVLEFMDSPGQRITMYYADNASWNPSVVGKIAAQVMYLDDVYTWTEIPIVNNKMEYTELSQMFILLSFLDGYDSIMSSYEIVKTEVKIKVNA
jgi:hypothetical protein